MSDPTNSKLIPGIGRHPLPAYRGRGRFIFISYAHADSDRVFPEIKKFQDLGYNVWYDEGIAPANEWLDDILSHLGECVLFVCFVTDNLLSSENCKKEFRYAINIKKPILPIYLDDFDDMDMDNQWRYELLGIQGILKTTLDEEEYIFKFTGAFKNFGFEIFNFSKEFITKSLNEAELNAGLKINNIKDDLDDFFARLDSQDSSKRLYSNILKSNIDLFLNNPCPFISNEIYSNIFSLYEIMMPIENSDFLISGGEDSLRNLYRVLKNYDEKNYRENLVHCINVFLVGLAIYSRNGTYRDSFRTYVENTGYEYVLNDSGEYYEEFLIRWVFASLFHDACFSIEASERPVSNSFYNDLRSFLSWDEDSRIKGISEFNYLERGNGKVFGNLMEALDCNMATDLLAYKIACDFSLNNDEMKRISNNLRYFLNYMYENDFNEHGFLSSVLLLNAFNNQIEGYGLSFDYYYYPILDSASAILLHNYYRYVLQHDPFGLGRMSADNNPVAYLLILCDELLETAVDSVEISLSDELNITYDINSSSRGFGYHNKEKILNEVLEINDVFSGGLNIRKIVRDRSIFEIKKQEFHQRHKEPSIFIVDKLARTLHEQYNRSIREEYNNAVENASVDEGLSYRYENLVPFEKLTPLLHSSLIRQAKSIIEYVSFLRYDIVPISDEREAIPGFNRLEVENLSRLEHEKWCDERIATGWKYGPEKDEERLITPYLVPWEELDSEIQVIDMDFVKNITQLLAREKLKVVRSKLNLFTREMHNYYCEFSDNHIAFENLPYSIQESNFQQTNHLFNILSGIGYSIVGKANPQEAVESFDDETVNYIAKCLHEEWVKSRLNLGGSFSRNLVSWEELDSHVREDNRMTMSNLAVLCERSGLKIIRD